MITAEDLTRREVHYCVSSLVYTLAQGHGCTPGRTSDHQSIGELCEQALELAAPIPDYEEAATQAGWKYAPLCWIRPKTPDDPNLYVGNVMAAATAEIACRIDDLDPYDREVYEHWIVSDWLAEKLEEKGEKVDRDFAGMTVWARTTTGQPISSDSVIEAIAAELAVECGEAAQ